MLKAVSLRSNKRNLISLFNTSKLSSAPTTHGDHDVAHQTVLHPRIGKREIVGYGINGQPSYFDNAVVPLPGVRWLPADENINQIREKAKGDWSKLTIDEKKACKFFLYHFIIIVILN